MLQHALLILTKQSNAVAIIYFLRNVSDHRCLWLCGGDRWDDTWQMVLGDIQTRVLSTGTEPQYSYTEAKQLHFFGHILIFLSFGDSIHKSFSNLYSIADIKVYLFNSTTTFMMENPVAQLAKKRIYGSLIGHFRMLHLPYNILYNYGK